MTIHQDVDLYGSVLETDETVSFEVRPERKAWIQVARGTVTAGDQPLYAGDGLAVTEAGPVEITATDRTEFLVFDLAA